MSVLGWIGVKVGSDMSSLEERGLVDVVAEKIFETYTTS